MKDESKYLSDKDNILFDSTTGETLNRGIAMDAPNKPHDVRQERERAMEDFCFRMNCILHGEQRALELWRVANK